MERHHFLMRRLHSLTGVAPIGVFLIAHLTTNSSIVWGEMLYALGLSKAGGAETFQHEVDFIHSLPFLVLIEIFGLWIPIAFHSILGVYYATTGKSNVGAYPHRDNWRYTLQRVSGYIGLVYIFYHVATLRWGWTWLPFTNVFDPEKAASTTATALRGGAESVWWHGGIIVGVLYLAGITMLVFHFANGLWTAAITWGVTITEKAQQRWKWVCMAIGAGLMVAGWAAYIGFVAVDLDTIREQEQRQYEDVGGAETFDASVEPLGALPHPGHAPIRMVPERAHNPSPVA
jgi:succinate dehydrogenase / fumarate reductase cytochrome b subunit